MADRRQHYFYFCYFLQHSAIRLGIGACYSNLQKSEKKKVKFRNYGLTSYYYKNKTITMMKSSILSYHMPSLVLCAFYTLSHFNCHIKLVKYYSHLTDKETEVQRN